MSELEQSPALDDGREAAILFAFCGWLTTRKETISLGATCECSAVPGLIVDFLKSQGLSTDPPELWHFNIKPYPRDESDAQEAVRK